MEAIILAGGKGERLGEAAQGLPKPLVPVRGKPLMAYQVGLLKRAGVTRVIVSCAAGMGTAFEQALGDLGVELAVAEEPEPLGRGGGLRFAAALRHEDGDVYALNGDELLTPDFSDLLESHRGRGAAATLIVAPLRSAVGIVDVQDDDRITSFKEAPVLPHWVSAGVYVLGPEAVERLPERGDQERTTFPELAAEDKLFAYRFEGQWLTVNTPKELRLAEDAVARHPEWLEATAA